MRMVAIYYPFVLGLVLTAIACQAVPRRLRSRVLRDDFDLVRDALFGGSDESWRSDQLFSLSMQYDEVPVGLSPTDDIASPSPVAMPMPSIAVQTQIPSISTNLTPIPSNAPTASTSLTSPSTDIPLVQPTDAPLTQAPTAISTTEPSDRLTSMPSTDTPTDSPTVVPSTQEPSLAPSDVSLIVFPTTGPSEGSDTDTPVASTELVGCDDENKREIDLYAVLSLVAQDIDDPSSPAGKAWGWLVQDDVRHLCDGDDPTLVQRFFLAIIYFSTSGETWMVRDTDPSFLSSVSECDWSGVNCNTEGLVRNIELDDRGLFGTIPSEIATIESLRVLGLRDNQISGTLPETLNNIDPFLVLRVQNNLLQGTIPSGLSSSLVRLLVHDNYISGMLPTSNLSKLRMLQVQNNAMTGTIPDSLMNATDLTVARFTNNAFTGTMPDGMCLLSSEHKLTQLTVDCPEVTCSCCTNSACGN